MSSKSTLRQHFLKQRRKLSIEERQHQSLQAAQHLFQLPVFQKASTLHTFLSQPDEIQTRAIIEEAWKQKKHVMVPYMIPNSKVLGHSELFSFSQLEEGPFQVPQPKPSERTSVDIQSIELVLVPGVAFDRNGGRLGYGKGYYDRFLSLLKQRELRLIGMAFDCQLSQESLPMDAHDVKMHDVITSS